MLVFTIPIKSAKVAKSWNQTCKLLERTLRSVCHQTSDQFRVIVVCHEKPQVNFSHSHIDYIEVDFPAPKDNRESKVMDRIRKELVSLIYARRFSPCHIMKVDADDCVSTHLAQFVEDYPQANGWFFDKGYIYLEGSRNVFLKRRNFYKWSGTSNILRADLYDFNKLGSPAIPKADEDCLAYYVSHHKIRETMSERGTPIKPLPFWGAVYFIGHGENSNPVNANPSNNEGLISYDRPVLERLKNILFFWRPLTKSQCEEFGIWNLNGERPISEIFVFDLCLGILEMTLKAIEPSLKSISRRLPGAKY